MDDWWLLAVESVSVACAFHLWAKARGSVVKKAAWTPVVVLPVLGPLAYGGIYEAPSVQADDLRAKETDMHFVDHARRE